MTDLAPTNGSPPESGSEFWWFSLRFYRQPGVADACIALQDGCGVDVNVLLYFLWLASERQSLGLAAVTEVCGKAAAWRDEVVAPLRSLRRRLKDWNAFVERGSAELFRTRIKAVELEAERLQQEALFGLTAGLTAALATPPPGSVADAAAANIAAYEAVIGQTFAPDAVRTLIAGLPAGHAAAT